MERPTSNVFSFDEFEVDSEKRVLLRGGIRVVLKPKTFDLLLTLAENPGRLLSKDELLEKVWKDRFIEENNLTVHIAALRKALGEKKGDNRFIVTLPHEGYRFVPTPTFGNLVHEITEKHETRRIVVEEETYEFDDGADQTGILTRGRIVPVVIATLLIAGVFIGYRFLGTTPQVGVGSVAVLPFVNLSGDVNSEYLSDGLSDSLIYSLSHVRNLRVMSRSSTFRYKGQAFDTKKVAAELNVQAIVTGSVIRRGEDLIVTAEMIDPADNSVIWGEQFTRKFAEISRLQPDIVKSITEKLRVRLGTDQPRQTESAEAYELYLQGLYLLNKRTGESIRKSIGLFERATSIDPNYAPAYGALAMAHMAYHTNTLPPKAEIAEHRQKQKSAAVKALELDDNQAEARAVLAFGLMDEEWDFAGAENELRRAIETSPNLPIVHQWYSQLLARLGRYDEALKEIKKAYELDPFSRSVNVNLGRCYSKAGYPDAAVAEFEKLIEHDPDYPWAHILLGTFYEEQGNYAEAIEPLLRGQLLLGVETEESFRTKVDALRQALKKDGSRGYWLAGLAIELEYFKRGQTFAGSIAAKYAQLGENDMAMEWLEKEFREGDKSAMTFVKEEAAFRSLADDTRFQDLLRRVGFPQK